MILRCTFLARRSAKLIDNFSATMVTSLPSFSLSLCISLSLSLSPNVPHAQYRKRFRASYNKVSRQECERQQCERHQCEANSANANSAKGSTVRMPTVRMRQRCECQQCECDSSAKDDSPNCAKPIGLSLSLFFCKNFCYFLPQFLT